MATTDPIADMLTRIRNANAAGAEMVNVPASRIKVAIAKILREEGFIKHYRVVREAPKKGAAAKDAERGNPLEKQSTLQVYLKYGAKQERVVHGLKRVSRPSLRRYVGAQEIPRVEGGLGISILSTSRGFLVGHECRKRNVGGELICTIW